ncbi:hypothetical protein J4455_00630 [Candidatus Woesearchaeota archaeon]|nr:hypothetical protein [Candidatus Woesearchaeota archaeon]
MTNIHYRIIAKLQTIKGISNIHQLRAYDKKFIKENESPNNLGVHACIKRKVTLMITHDSSFRDPDSRISYEDHGQIYFPPVPFHEISGKNVISSSPGEKVHDYLVERFKLKLLNKEATLLISFD